jgi:hypothetical protein
MADKFPDHFTNVGLKAKHINAVLDKLNGKVQNISR